ncbi:hypothetical protein [Pseudomonas sp. nanlin1]|uniref:hypothetical protein n=1 Tax=Pseudomonas sp. nanlin1 TaxID=3040605 RepID=UPI00388DF638
MPPTKRDNARLERLLITCLTDACETAKSEIVGFQWLTHEADFQALAQSLRVVWVFDTQAHREQALAAGQAARMIELTAMALAAADVAIAHPARHVYFDSEEECRARDRG